MGKRRRARKYVLFFIFFNTRKSLCISIEKVQFRNVVDMEEGEHTVVDTVDEEGVGYAVLVTPGDFLCRIIL
jgi:hypothetical protein